MKELSHLQKFWNNVKLHGVKTISNGLYTSFLFWNNVKPHGVKTKQQKFWKSIKFLNNGKQHSIKTAQVHMRAH